MNRTARRRQARLEKRSKGMAQQVESLPLNIHHGHTENQVLIRFSRTVDYVLLTPEQARAFLTGVEKSLTMLEEHIKPKKLDS